MIRPKIVVKVAATVDGKISIARNVTMWEEMDDPRTRVEGAEMVWADFEKKIHEIHHPQADLLGSNSLVKEGEMLRELPAFKGEPSQLYQDFLPNEVIHRTDHQGWLVVVDGRGRVRSGYKGENRWQMLHLVSHQAPPEYLAFLQREQIPYFIAGDERVDLCSVLEKMKTLLDIDCVVTSAGGQLSGALLRARLVDEVNVIVKPQIYGGFTTPVLFDAPDLNADEWPTPLQLVSVQMEAAGHVWLRYQVDYL